MPGPAALQLRLLQTVVEVAAEKNSTLVMPFPVELLRFFDRTARPAALARPPADEAETTDSLPPVTVPGMPVLTAPLQLATAPNTGKSFPESDNLSAWRAGPS
jgi:hypothetical protein